MKTPHKRPKHRTSDYWKHLTSKSSPHRHKPAAKQETKKATTMSNETTEEQPELVPPPAPAPPPPTEEELAKAPVQGPAAPPPTEDEPGADLPSPNLTHEEQIAAQPDQVGMIEAMGDPELALTPEMPEMEAWGTEPPAEGKDVSTKKKRK